MPAAFGSYSSPAVVPVTFQVSVARPGGGLWAGLGWRWAGSSVPPDTEGETNLHRFGLDPQNRTATCHESGPVSGRGQPGTDSEEDHRDPARARVSSLRGTSGCAGAGRRDLSHGVARRIFTLSDSVTDPADCRVR